MTVQVHVKPIYNLYIRLLIISIASVYSVLAHAQTCQKQALDHISASVVKVHAGDSQATGVVIADNTLLTVAHAIPSTSDILIYMGDKTHEPAHVLKLHHGYDLALLSVNTAGLTPIPLNLHKQKIDTLVWSIGYPKSTIQQTSEGRITQSTYSSVVSTAHVESGSSGGALLLCGQSGFELAGILQAYKIKWHAGSMKRSGLSVSVPLHAVKRFLDVYIPIN